MKYTHIEETLTGEFKILILGEPLQLSRCARTIMKITQGSEFYSRIESKLTAENIAEMETPNLFYVGDAKQEVLKCSWTGLEYSFSPNGHSKDVVGAAKSHYKAVLDALEPLMNYYDSPTILSQKYPDAIDYTK